MQAHVKPRIKATMRDWWSCITKVVDARSHGVRAHLRIYGAKAQELQQQRPGKQHTLHLAIAQRQVVAVIGQLSRRHGALHRKRARQRVRQPCQCHEG